MGRGAFAEDAQYFRVQCFILHRVQNAVGDREDSTTSNDSVELPVLPEPQRMVDNPVLHAYSTPTLSCQTTGDNTEYFLF